MSKEGEFQLQSVRLELLRPEQIEAALAQRSLVYLPLGTIEWHSYHLPVGLDALTAHGLCLRAAARTGGLVHPVLYYGTGGGHGHYPWTVMMSDSVEIRTLLNRTLTRLQDFGVCQAVILTGHFADEQQVLVDAIADEWADRNIRVTATSVNRSGHSIPPDHAGVFETLLLHALHPETVRLAALSEGPDFADRHDSSHPIWGVVGADPRLVDLTRSAGLLDFLSSWLVALADETPQRTRPQTDGLQL